MKWFNKNRFVIIFTIIAIVVLTAMIIAIELEINKPVVHKLLTLYSDHGAFMEEFACIKVEFSEGHITLGSGRFSNGTVEILTTDSVELIIRGGIIIVEDLE